MSSLSDIPNIHAFINDLSTEDVLYLDGLIQNRMLRDLAIRATDKNVTKHEGPLDVTFA